MEENRRENQMKSLSFLVLLVLSFGCTPNSPSPVIDHPPAEPQIEVLPIEEETSLEETLQEQEGPLYAPLMMSIQTDDWTHEMDRVSFTATLCGLHAFIAGNVQGSWMLCNTTWDVAGMPVECPMFMLSINEEIVMGYVSDGADESCDHLLSKISDEFTLGDFYTLKGFSLFDTPWTGELQGHSFRATACLGHEFDAGGTTGEWLFCDTLWPTQSGGVVSCPLLVVEQDDEAIVGFFPTEDFDPRCNDLGVELPASLSAGFDVEIDPVPSPLGPL